MRIYSRRVQRRQQHALVLSNAASPSAHFLVARGRLEGYHSLHDYVTASLHLLETANPKWTDSLPLEERRRGIRPWAESAPYAFDVRAPVEMRIHLPSVCWERLGCWKLLFYEGHRVNS